MDMRGECKIISKCDLSVHIFKSREIRTCRSPLTLRGDVGPRQRHLGCLRARSGRRLDDVQIAAYG